MAPTPPEEIERQHAAAVQLVKDGMPCAPRGELGEIPLSDKRRPTFLEKEGEEKKEGDADEGDLVQDLKIPCCFSTRGVVDVAPLQDLIREGYDETYPIPNPQGKDNKETGTKEAPFPPFSETNYWDPRNAAKKNVSITRPSHDAWGIKKIVLLFCDDFMTRVFQLPWWNEFEPVLKPVFDLLPPGHHLIRALLASLPPGVTIPIHHDTGEWVKTTHRVHVPVLISDPSKVIFRCGPSPTTMQRIDCTPGHVFEMNNQAKHAVSNCGLDSRVHLILDYTMEPKTRIMLQPGEKIIQTRRSIDRLFDIKNNPRPCPSFLILGAQKAGTTSLYEYMTQHPLVVRARRRETHCLDWRWNNELKTTKGRLAYCRKFFFAEKLAQHPSCMSGDSTPSYLLDSRRVIPRIKDVFNWDIRFFVMLRDPVRRAESHFAMVTSPEGTPAQLQTRGAEWRNKTIKEVIDMELDQLEGCGLIPYWDRKQGAVDWDSFSKFSGSKDEDQAWDTYLSQHVPLNTGSYGLLTRGMYELQLRPWFRAFDKKKFLVIQLERMKQQGVDTTMKQVWNHLDLPYFPIADDSPRNTRDYEDASDDLTKYLRNFFEPHNKRLAEMLGPEWKGAWT